MKFFQLFGRRKRDLQMVKPSSPTIEQTLSLLMMQIGAAQENFKEELKPVSKEYPLNGAILELATALSIIKRSKQPMYKITQNGIEHSRNLPSMKAANEIIHNIIAALPEDMPRAFDGEKLVIGNSDKDLPETVYKIELAA